MTSVDAVLDEYVWLTHAPGASEYFQRTESIAGVKVSSICQIFDGN